MPATSRLRPIAGAGLRARITITFGCGALFVSLLLVTTTAILIRRNLLDQRETNVEERAEVNAGLVADKIGKPDVDAQTLFGSLATAGKPSVLVRDPKGGKDYLPFSVDTRYGATALPKSLVNRVLKSKRPAVMRFNHKGEVLLAVGVPISGQDGAYFEVNQLDDIERSLSNLTIPLFAAVAMTTAIGAFLGFYASRRVLRPLAEISEVASDIASGKLDARLAYSEWADDPDLAPIVASFNGMVSEMQSRIDRDARFASDVSHELRSPLTTFNATVQVLRNARDDLPERAQLALDLLGSDLERFTQLVEDLLEISRFDAGAVRLEVDDVAIVETVRMAVRTLSPEPIPVEADPGLEGLIILCDKRRLVRVLANFIDNAAKYADGATRVLVEQAPSEHEPVDETEGERIDRVDRAERTDRTDRIRVEVEDSGPGVPEADRERIFDRFNRGGQGGSRGSDLGVGLGLALAAEHARIQGGSVWVDSRPDGKSGSRFVIELPIVEPSVPAEGEVFLDEVTAEHMALKITSEEGL
jgi:two-component system sensor histidine kinase MtrB